MMQSPTASATQPWPVLDSHVVFENGMMKLREDSVRLRNGERTQYAYVERGPAVIIVPITEAGEMVLLRQYRHAVRAYCLEVPAGTARDAGDLSLVQVAEKELKEEVGGQWKAVERIGSFFSNSSLSDEDCHVFLATGVTLSAEAQPESSEELETCVVPVREAVELAMRGEMKTGPTTLAVLLSLPRLRALGLL